MVIGQMICTISIWDHCSAKISDQIVVFSKKWYDRWSFINVYIKCYIYSLVTNCNKLLSYNRDCKMGPVNGFHTKYGWMIIIICQIPYFMTPYLSKNIMESYVRGS